MSNFRVAIVEHTVTPTGCEAITWDLCYERFIHAEFMTHRWARNASSSRAIPYRAKDSKKIGMIDWILRDPAMPLHLGANRPGMQSGDEINDPETAREMIKQLLDVTITTCDHLYLIRDLHKEIVNRYVEPWGWINVVATMGKAQLMNFFKLRVDKYAHPNIQRLAVTMAREYRASKPRQLEAGEWHLPFVSMEQRIDYYNKKINLSELLHWSVARCAWCSFKTVDGRTATYDDAIKRHNDCVELKHMTPCEHQVRARADFGQTGCVKGYDQYRHMIPGESTETFDFTILDTVYSNRDYIVP